MRGDANKAKLEAFMDALGKRVKGPGTICFTVGVTDLLFGWREKNRPRFESRSRVGRSKAF
jgi:hypothetical protein